MLQRAASNAYSWWWASHIRTNQSKWLDNNLQDMEDRVKSMLKIIEEDADSFAKRAEMYYKKRPELINFVEESYRAYRALAERFDHISGELHKANHTLATAFPDVQFPMQDEDEDSSPKAIPSVDPKKIPKPLAEFPRFSLMNKKSESKPPSKPPLPKRITSKLSEEEAKEEINRLQKGILVLQTEKEFIKSSYESGMAKYWEIEKHITEMQEGVCILEDEFSASAVIEDDEARALMAVTALKSCKDTLVSLQEQQKRSVEETRIESERIRVAKEKLRALKGEYGQSDKEIGEISDENSRIIPSEEASDLQQERLELQSICEKVKDHFESGSDTSVVDLAEKIDELVNKVISLELTVSSQSAQITRLRSETDDLQKHLWGLEDEKVSLIHDSNSLNERLKQAEENLHNVQNLEKRVQRGKSMLHTDLTEACLSLNNVSEKLQSPKHQEQIIIAAPSDDVLNLEPQQSESEEKEIIELQDLNDEVEEEANGFQEHAPLSEDHKNNVESKPITLLENDSEKSKFCLIEDDIIEKDTAQANDSDRLIEQEMSNAEQEEASNLEKLLLNGLEGREKILLEEYTSILRNYKETKKRLLVVEKKNQEYYSETMSQVQELRSDNAVKDDQIRSLRKILSLIQRGSKVVSAEDSTESSKLQNQENPEDLNMETDRVFNPQPASAFEEKFRRDIDTLLDENLEFWLRFSTSFHQIQRFRTEFQTLQSDIEKLSDEKMDSSSYAADHGVKPETAPAEKQLRELKTELQVWIEQNALLRGELQKRFSSLCSIHDEISGASKGGQFTQYQAAKFQGEVLNMKQENNKVAVELNAGLDHVKGLQVEVEKILSKLHEKFELSASKIGHHHHHFRHFSSKSRGVPLRSFLYGVKPKKPSIFSCMNPALQKQYSDLRAGFSL